MFGLSFTHLLLLGAIALIFIGPDELPKVARTLGRLLNEIRRGSDSFKDEFRRSAGNLRNDFRIEPPDQHPGIQTNVQVADAPTTSVQEHVTADLAGGGKKSNG